MISGWPAATLAALLGAVISMHPVAAAEIVQFERHGIRIAGKPKPADATFDIEIIPAAEGAAKVAAALDLLLEKSPYNAAALDQLKAAGTVYIIYDPAFPARALTDITIAAFLPDFYQADGVSKDFVTVVGRFGAKWTARELAPVIAHELTGHGIQHLRGRLDNVREVDLECEAYLYQEKAYQDLGFDKGTAEMVAFRQKLERHWCADFRAWQRQNRAAGAALWDTRNPDVPKLLADYLTYIKALQASGVAGRAVSNARAAQDVATNARIARLAASGDAEDQFQLGLIYQRGLGVPADPAAAKRWLQKAADAGHPVARQILGSLDGAPSGR